MEALPNLQEMSLDQLNRLRLGQEFYNLPPEQQRQVTEAYRQKQEEARRAAGGTNFWLAPPNLPPIGRVLFPENGEQRQQEVQRAQERFGFSEPMRPPAPPPPPAEDPSSIASAISRMGGELPNFEMQPRAPAPPVPASAERPPAPAPVARPSAPAAGAAPAARPTQPGIEDVIAQRLGALKPPESAQSFMDSPYLALVQAGLSMIADSRGKSALEAIAGGGRAGLQTLAQQRADQRAREEKNYERQLNRLKIESDLRDSMGRLQNYQDTIRLKEAELEQAKRQGASEIELRQGAQRLAQLQYEAEVERNRIAAMREDRAERDLSRQERRDRLNFLDRVYQQNADIIQRLGMDNTNPDVQRARRIMAGIEREVRELGVNLPQGTQGGSVESAAGMARRPG